MKKTVFIYGLRCVGAKMFRYIGISNNPTSRLRQHMAEDYGYTPKSAWIKRCKKENRKIETVVLAECDCFFHAHAIETSLIRGFCLAGYPILNEVGSGTRKRYVSEVKK